MNVTERLSRLIEQLPSPQSVIGEGGRTLAEPLSDCLPDFVRRLSARYNRRLVIHPEGSQARVSLVAGLETQLLGELGPAHDGYLPGFSGVAEPDRPHRIELCLPPEVVLKRTVSFPSQVRANLPQVIGYELDRLSPFDSRDVLFDFVATSGGRGTDRLRLDLALCRRNAVDDWIARLDALGASIDRITWEGAWNGANLLPREQRPKRRRLRPTLGSVSVMLSILLVPAILLTPLWQKQQLAQRLDAEAARLRTQAIAVDEVRRELEQVRQGSTAVIERKLEQSSVLEILRELTDRLPEDTWVQNLEFSNGEVDIRGESGQATALIAILEQAPGIEGVFFGSPVTQMARTGKERFNISFRYTHPDSP